MKARTIAIGLIAIAAITIVILMSSGETEAADITVGVGGDHSNIQDALNASNDGDTIYVWEGTYTNRIWINNSISLIGNSTTNTTINTTTTIAGTDIHAGITVNAPWVNITGFEIKANRSGGVAHALRFRHDSEWGQWCWVYDNYFNNTGGVSGKVAISIRTNDDDGDYVRIQNNNITDFQIAFYGNIDDDGEETDVGSNNIDIVNNTINNGYSYLKNYSFVWIANNTFSPSISGGIKCDVCINTTVYNNTGTGEIRAEGWNITIYENNITQTCYLSGYNSTMFNNTAQEYNVGGVNNTVHDNIAIGQSVTGIAVFGELHQIYENVFETKYIGIDIGLLTGVGNCTFYNNTIIGESTNPGIEDTGIRIYRGWCNTVYHNNILNKTYAIDEIYGAGTNTWNLSRPIGGNFFDQWWSPDVDDDGFVDNPLAERGDSGYDYLPYTYRDGWRNVIANISSPANDTDFGYDTELGECEIQFGALGTINTEYYNWSWDDGSYTNGTEKNVSHIYNSTGTYNVTLYVGNTSVLGILNETTITVNVVIYTPSVSIAAPANGTSHARYASIQFLAFGSYSDSYNWSWGDGSYFEEYSGFSLKNHIYTDVLGDVLVNITVFNNTCKTYGYDEITITITGNPNATISAPANNTLIFYNKEAWFYANGSFGADYYNWTWGDGNYTNSTETYANHTFQIWGDITINLTVYNSTVGTTDTAQVTTHIPEPGSVEESTERIGLTYIILYAILPILAVLLITRQLMHWFQETMEEELRK